MSKESSFSYIILVFSVISMSDITNQQASDQQSDQSHSVNLDDVIDAVTELANSLNQVKAQLKTQDD